MTSPLKAESGGRLFDMGGVWHQVAKTDPRARQLADRHYSRQTVGATCFTGPGKSLALLTDCGRAVWAVVENLDAVGATQWRCTIFRNEGAGLSSELIREATARTFAFWARHYGRVPPMPLRTEVDRDATRPKKNPGWCFLKAGWRNAGRTKGGLWILETTNG